MLKADRAHLEARMRQLALTIREKEFNLFNQNFQILGKQAAFLAGQGFALLYMKAQYIDAVNKKYGWRDYNSTPEVLFAAFVSIGIGLNVLVMAITSWCMVFGADLAIRGQSYESTKRAVDGMYQERKITVRIFLCGIGCLVASGFTLGWTAYRDASQKAVMIVFACTGFTTAWFLYRRTRPRFRVPKESRGYNRPDAYLIGSGAYDMESGRAVQQPYVPNPLTQPLTPQGPQAESHLSRR